MRIDYLSLVDCSAQKMVQTKAQWTVYTMALCLVLLLELLTVLLPVCAWGARDVKEDNNMY